MSGELKKIKAEKRTLESKIEIALYEFLREVGNCKIEIELEQITLETETEETYIDFGIRVKVNVII